MLNYQDANKMLEFFANVKKFSFLYEGQYRKGFEFVGTLDTPPQSQNDGLFTLLTGMILNTDNRNEVIATFSKSGYFREGTPSTQSVTAGASCSEGITERVMTSDTFIKYHEAGLDILAIHGSGYTNLGFTVGQYYTNKEGNLEKQRRVDYDTANKHGYKNNQGVLIPNKEGVWLPAKNWEVTGTLHGLPVTIKSYAHGDIESSVTIEKPFPENEFLRQINMIREVTELLAGIPRENAK